jgi:hypothetical protein
VPLKVVGEVTSAKCQVEGVCMLGVGAGGVVCHGVE